MIMLMPNSKTSEVSDEFVLLFQGQEYRASPRLHPSVCLPSSSSAYQPIRNNAPSLLNQRVKVMDVEEYTHSKKRKLTKEQLRRLDESFEEDEMLNTKKKMELALELGLRPSQVSIWHRNQRARCKAKKSEDGSASLRDPYDNLLEEHHTLKVREEDSSAKGEVVDPESSLELEDEFDGCMSFPELAAMMHTAMMIHY